MEETKALISRATARDALPAERHVAFGEIVSRFQDMAFGCAYAVLGDFYLAQDAAQEAFITAWQKLDQLQQPDAFPGWFRRIVLTECNRLRRGKRLPFLPLEAGSRVPAAEADPAVIAEREELKERVLSEIKALPEKERMVTTLFYIDGYSQNDISDFLEVPITTVAKRLYSARQRMKERMLEMYKDNLEQHRPSRDEAFAEQIRARLRPFVEQDWKPILDIATAIGPDDSKGSDLWLRNRQLFDETRFNRRHYIAEHADTHQILGYGSIEQSIFLPNYRIFIVTESKWLREGVGDLLYDRLMKDLEDLDAITVWVRDYESKTEHLNFFRERGFVEKISSGYVTLEKFLKGTASMDSAAYDSYVGEYEVEPEELLKYGKSPEGKLLATVTREGGNLMIEGNNQKNQLFPESESIFFFKEFYGKVEFVKDKKGEVTQMIYREPGVEVKGKRRKPQSHKDQIKIFCLCAFVVLSSLLFGSQVVANQEKSAEQVYKNIQVFKGLPASQLLGAMVFMSSALKVDCTHCHVQNRFDLEEKPAKQKAREMILMMRTINQGNFGDRLAVNCYTCHRGRLNPPTTLSLEEEPKKPITEKSSEQLPTVDQILDKYLHAVGSESDIDNLKSIKMKGSQVTMKGTDPPSTLNIELYKKNPNKILLLMGTREEGFYQAYNGTMAWRKSGSRVGEMKGPDAAMAKRESDIYKDIKLKGQYTKMALYGKEKIGDRDAYVIEATFPEDSPERFLYKTENEKLYFDAQTGLLIRRYMEYKTVLGVVPGMTDYEDYRKISGLMVPFTIRMSRPPSINILKFSEIEINSPIEETYFDMPQTPSK